MGGPSPLNMIPAGNMDFLVFWPCRWTSRIALFIVDSSVCTSNLNTFGPVDGLVISYGVRLIVFPIIRGQTCTVETA